MTTKEFEEMFGQKFSIDTDNTFDNAINTELEDEDDDDGECIDNVQKESSSLNLSFAPYESGDTEFNMFDESSDDLSLSFMDNNKNPEPLEESDDLELSFMKESSEVEDDLYVGNENFEDQFDLMTDDDDGLDVADDCGDAEYIDDDDLDGECIDIVEGE